LTIADGLLQNTFFKNQPFSIIKPDKEKIC